MSLGGTGLAECAGPAKALVLEVLEFGFGTPVPPERGRRIPSASRILPGLANEIDLVVLLSLSRYKFEVSSSSR